MREGRWMLNGAPIVISANGQVLDGRIRLIACINSNSNFDTLVVEGVDPNTYETMDAVRKITLADVLSIRHEKHGRALAAALRIIWFYMNGSIPSTSKPPYPIALLNILEERPGIRDSVLPSLRATPLLPHGCAIALHFLMGLVHQAKADRFISLIGQPAPSVDMSPISQLRQVLEDLRGQGGTRKQSYILAITIKTWNSFLSGKPLKRLKYDSEREGFPQIYGLPLLPGPLFEINNKLASRNSKHQTKKEHSCICARVVIITPIMAETLLRHNKLNRHVSASVIQKYSRDMVAGRWKLNGQTIKISSSGQLLDGQHRLEAAKKARRGFPAIIVEGLDENTFTSLDIGHRRSLSDVLRERGENNTIVLASSLRCLWMIKNQVVLAANSSPTNGELLLLLEENGTLRQSLKHVPPIREIMGSGIACALHYLFSAKDKSRADEFFSRLIDGLQLSEDSPVYHLRERLIRTRSSHRVRLAEAERVALTIKSWNSFKDNRPMQILAWQNRGTAREPLPAPL